MASKLSMKNNLNNELTITHNNDTLPITVDSVDLSKVITINSLSELKNKVGGSKHKPPTIWISGYHNKGDNAFGSHIFEWDENSNEPHNGGTIIDPNADFPTDWTDKTQLDNWFNYTSTTNGRYKLKYSGVVNVKWFGVKGDGISNDTQAFKKAAEFKDIYIPNISVIITETINLDDGTKIKGTRTGLIQGISSHIENGPNRINLYDDSTIKFIPNNINDSLFVLGKDCVIDGISIIYPNQTLSGSTPIKYGTTIIGNSSTNLLNIKVIGAYNFFYSNGNEAIYIDSIYGWVLGKAFETINSTDICRFNNIHLNPNCIRPDSSILDYTKDNSDSVAFIINGCNGTILSNIHIYGFNTGVILNELTGQSQFIINNFFFDSTGLAFDISSSSGWSTNIANGVVVYGYGTDSSTKGFIKIRKETANFGNIHNINIANVSGVNPSSGNYVKADYAIEFIANSGYYLKAQNVVLDSKTLINEKVYNVIEGSISDGDTLFSFDGEERINFIPNPKMILNENNKPYGLTTAFGDYGYIYSNSNGFTKIQGTKTNDTLWHGEGFRVGTPYPVSSPTFFMLAKNVTGNVGIYCYGYNSDWSGVVETGFVTYKKVADNLYVFEYTIKSVSKSIFDFKIHIGDENSSLEVVYIGITNHTGKVISEKSLPINAISQFEDKFIIDEEISWNPKFIISNEPTYNTNKGKYYRVGNRVEFTIELDYSNLDTSDTSAIQIQLPVGNVIKNINANIQEKSSTGIDLSQTGRVSCDILNNNKLIFGQDNNSYLSYNSTGVSNSGKLYITGIYWIDS